MNIKMEWQLLREVDKYVILFKTVVRRIQASVSACADRFVCPAVHMDKKT